LTGLEYIISLSYKNRNQLLQEFGLKNSELTFDDFTSDHVSRTIVDIIYRMTNIPHKLLQAETDEINKLEIIKRLILREMNREPIFNGYKDQLSLFGLEYCLHGEDALNYVEKLRKERMVDKIKKYFSELDFDDQEKILRKFYEVVLKEDADFDILSDDN